jgi:hypothetical protein
MASIALDKLGWYGRRVGNLIPRGTAFRIAEGHALVTVTGLGWWVCVAAQYEMGTSTARSA